MGGSEVASPGFGLESLAYILKGGLGTQPSLALPLGGGPNP